MTYTEKLIEALKLIRHEGELRTCDHCELYGIACGYGIDNPASWRVEALGVEDDE